MDLVRIIGSVFSFGKGRFDQVKGLAESEVTNPGNTPSLPLPPTWSEEELRDLIASVRVEGGPSEDRKSFVSLGAPSIITPPAFRC